VVIAAAAARGETAKKSKPPKATQSRGDPSVFPSPDDLGRRFATRRPAANILFAVNRARRNMLTVMRHRLATLGSGVVLEPAGAA
jgi:hypothetical protein